MGLHYMELPNSIYDATLRFVPPNSISSREPALITSFAWEFAVQNQPLSRPRHGLRQTPVNYLEV